MAEGALYVILEMITLLIQNSVGTVMSILGLSGDLVTSLSPVSQSGGLLGLLIVFGIVFVVGYFLMKFFMGSVKSVVMLLFGGVLLVLFIVLGLSLF
jgi:lipopolysaccharide export LptBFGC system permease protein LptF